MQDDVLAGIAWAVHTVLFAAVLPMAYIKYGVRRGRWGDRQVGERKSRLHLIPVIMTLVGAGLAIMLVLDARSR